MGKIILIKIILILALICMIVLLIFVQTGNYTTIKCADYDHPDDAITAIGASNKTLLVTESETCDTNFTVPTNVTVKFERGGKWTINDAITITFNGQIDAGLWQIFAYVGTGTLAGTTIVKEVYPQWWATGDGTVENPWANDCIKKAYVFVPDGGTIYLKAGYYQLAGQVYITKQINIIGEGMNKTVIKTAGTHGFNVYADYVSIKNLTVDGDAQEDGLAYNTCIQFADCTHALLEDIEVKNGGYYGMNIYGVNHLLFQNIYAHDNYRHGVHPGTDTVGTNKYNTYRDIYAWNNGYNGFDDRGNTADPNEELHNIYDNLVCWENGTYGIALEMINGGNLVNSSAFNNVTGMYFHTIKNFTIENCSANSNYHRGIYLYNCENVNLSNVITKNNSTSNTAGDPGIHIYNSPSVKLSLCQSYDDRDSMLQDYGIKTTGTTKYVEITNCRLTPNEEGAILNDANAIILSRDEK